MTKEQKTEIHNHNVIKRSWGERFRAWRWPFFAGLALGGAGGIGTAPVKPVIATEPAVKVVEVPKIIERQPVEVRVNYCGKEQPVIRVNGEEQK